MLRELDPEHNTPREMTFIEAFGAKIRAIIDTFPKKTGRDPTPADIIWCLGCDENKDPHLLMQCMVPCDTSEQNNEPQ